MGSGARSNVDKKCGLLYNSCSLGATVDLTTVAHWAKLLFSRQYMQSLAIRLHKFRIKIRELAPISAYMQHFYCGKYFTIFYTFHYIFLTCCRRCHSSRGSPVWAGCSCPVSLSVTNRTHSISIRRNRLCYVLVPSILFYCILIHFSTS